MNYLGRLRKLLFSDSFDVRDVTQNFRHRSRGGIVVALVQAKVLWLLWRRERTLDDDGIQSRLQNEVIVDVGTYDDDSKRPAVSLDKEALFDSHLSTVCGVWTDPLASVFLFR